MSFSLAVYFCTRPSPHGELATILREFGETRTETDDGYWWTQIDRSSLHFKLDELDRPEWFGYDLGYRWRFGVHANTGCTPTTRWAQFAVVYRCVAFIDGAVGYDLQNGEFYQCPDSFWEYAGRTIPRWRELPRQLRNLHLMTDDGRLALDRPPT